MSIRIPARRRARRPTCILATIALCGLATVAWAQATAPTPAVQAQRNAFRAAYAAAQAGNDWRSLATGLEDYPLYPYLEAAALQQDLDTATRAQVDAYLQRYPGLIPAENLRKAELRQLAQQKDWAGFRHFYQPGLGDALACYALQAQLAEGKPLDFNRDLASLWQQTSLPSACKPVLDAASAQGLLPPERVWDRIARAADAGESATVAGSAAWLTGADATAATRVAEALRSPTNLLKKAGGLDDTPRNREAASYALARLARRNGGQADTYWQSLSKQFKFDQAQRDRVLAAIALDNAKDFEPGALAGLAALPATAQTDATREWRVRLAVAGGDWKAAEVAIAALTPEQMQDDEWRYWKARVAQKLGHDAAALDGFTALARDASFYGYLSADRANLPYSICPATVPSDAAMDRQLEANPGLARAFEFFALDMLAPARREWDRAAASLSPDQLVRAAALATQRGWYDRAIFAFGKSGQLDYYALRFPLADKDRVLTASRAAGIDPAWAYAIIRAESAWNPEARSVADARGLMQLLPSTAKLVARRSDLPYDGASSLYDPAINIPLGTRYLASLATRFDGSPWLASASYNAGPGNAQRWVDARGNLDPEAFILAIPFNETRDYVTRVMSFATMYDWRLHGKALPVSTRLPAIGTPYDPVADPTRKAVVCRAPDTSTPPGLPGTPHSPASARSTSR